MALMESSRLKQYLNTVFFETRTGSGDGIQKALGAGFKQIISVELNQKNFEQARERFKSNTSVKILFGKSHEAMEDLLQSIDSPITFWLDAHFNSPQGKTCADNGFSLSPLLKELDAIRRSRKNKKDIIIVDDVRLFGQYGFSKGEVIQKLYDMNKNFIIRCEDGEGQNIDLKNDNLVAYYDAGKKKELICHSASGMCNRITVLVSGLALAEETGRKFTMFWPKTSTCNCSFSDLFTNKLNIIEEETDINLFMQHNASKGKTDFLQYTDKILKITSNSWLFNEEYSHHARLRSRTKEIFCELEPVSHIQDKVSKIKNEQFTKQTMGMHLRRGDYRVLAPKHIYNTNLALKDATRFLNKYSGSRIFLSTDDDAKNPFNSKVLIKKEGVVDKFKNKFGDRCFTSNPSSLDRDSSKSIQDALVDLLLLRETDFFIGTRMSSFSLLAIFANDIKYWLYDPFALSFKAFYSKIPYFFSRLKEKFIKN